MAEAPTNPGRANFNPKTVSSRAVARRPLFSSVPLATAKQADALGFRDLLESFQRNRTEGATYAIDSWRSPSYLNRTAVAVTHIGTGLGEYAVPVESRNRTVAVLLHSSGLSCMN